MENILIIRFYSTTIILNTLKKFFKKSNDSFFNRFIVLEIFLGQCVLLSLIRNCWIKPSTEDGILFISGFLIFSQEIFIIIYQFYQRLLCLEFSTEYVLNMLFVYEFNAKKHKLLQLTFYNEDFCFYLLHK